MSKRDYKIYHSDNENQIVWAFRRASRHKELDVRLNSIEKNYLYWLYISMPDGAGLEAQKQFKMICNEIDTDHQCSVIYEHDNLANYHETAQAVFNLPQL